MKESSDDGVDGEGGGKRERQHTHVYNKHDHCRFVYIIAYRCRIQ